MPISIGTLEAILRECVWSHEITSLRLLYIRIVSESGLCSIEQSPFNLSLGPHV